MKTIVKKNISEGKSERNLMKVIQTITNFRKVGQQVEVTGEFRQPKNESEEALGERIATYGISRYKQKAALSINLDVLKL